MDANLIGTTPDPVPSYKQQLIFSVSLQYQMAVGYDHWNIILGDQPDDPLGLLILGALPIKDTAYIPTKALLDSSNHDDELIKLCNDKKKPLKIIVSAIQDFEKAGTFTLVYPVQTTDWENHKIKQLHVKVPDNTFNLPYEEVEKIIDEMHQARLNGESCYVHCKAGRGRSLVFTVCYLLKYSEYNTFELAYSYVKSKRDQINPSQQQLDYIKGFERHLVLPTENPTLNPESIKVKFNGSL